MANRLLLLIAALWMLAPVSAHAGEPLGLNELLAEAEAHNPELLSYDNRILAAKERIPQAAAFDDPMLSLGFTNVVIEGMAFDKEPMTMKEVGLSQKLPFFGKRALRGKVASYEAMEAGTEHHEKALLIRSEVKGAYYGLYSIKKGLEVVEKNIELMGIFKKIAETGYSVGRGTMKDVVKSQLEVSSLIEKRLELQKEARTKRAYLGSLLGRHEAVDVKVEDINPAKLAIEPAALAEAALTARPVLLAAQYRIDKAQAKTELAKKDYFPDFEFAVRYGQRDKLADGTSQSDMVSAMITINLPVWRDQKLAPAVREAAYERVMAEKEKDALTAEIYYRIDSLNNEVEQDDRILKLYKDAAIPQATEDLNNAVAGYEVGRLDFLTLLDSRRTLYEYELGWYNALAAREKAVAELEAVVGMELNK